MPTTFLSLPRELRQNILFLSHELNLTAPKRKIMLAFFDRPRSMMIEFRRKQQSLIYADHITEGDRYMGMLRGIGEELKQAHPALEEDVEYVVGKWIDGVMKWLDHAEKSFQEGDASLKRQLEEL